jgi:hypothetical protein
VIRTRDLLCFGCEHLAASPSLPCLARAARRTPSWPSRRAFTTEQGSGAASTKTEQPPPCRALSGAQPQNQRSPAFEKCRTPDGSDGDGLRMLAFARKQGLRTDRSRRETDDGAAGLARGEKRVPHASGQAPALRRTRCSSGEATTMPGSFRGERWAGAGSPNVGIRRAVASLVLDVDRSECPLECSLLQFDP